MPWNNSRVGVSHNSHAKDMIYILFASSRMWMYVFVCSAALLLFCVLLAHAAAKGSFKSHFWICFVNHVWFLPVSPALFCAVESLIVTSLAHTLGYCCECLLKEEHQLGFMLEIGYCIIASPWGYCLCQVLLQKDMYPTRPCVPN